MTKAKCPHCNVICESDHQFRNSTYDCKMLTVTLGSYSYKGDYKKLLVPDGNLWRQYGDIKDDEE